MPVSSLRNWNQLDQASTLQPGMKLFVWIDTNKAVPAAIKVSYKRKPAADGQQIKYEVRTGDSLWTISRQFSVSVEELMEWNSLPDKSYLKPGQQLTLYLKRQLRESA